MSFIDQLRTMAATAAQDVRDVFASGLTMNEIMVIAAHIKADQAVIQGDIDSAISQLAKAAPAIVSDIQAMMTVIQGLATAGLIAGAAISPYIAAAQAAVLGLQAIQAAQAAGEPSGAVVVAGVTAVNQAAGAKSAAVLAALNAIGVK